MALGRVRLLAILTLAVLAGLVAALRSYFAPPSKSGFGPVDVEKGMETVLTFFKPAIAVDSAQMLDRVWMNLIRNAIQAMEYRGELSLSIAPSVWFVRVEITDSDPGIPSRIARRIFEPFNTTKGDGHGMGLGLGICKSIVVTHGGTIEFASKPGRATFAVTLPEYMPRSRATELPRGD
jgi:signal transduction histidine kinase